MNTNTLKSGVVELSILVVTMMALSLLAAFSASAADTDNVTATVTAQVVSVEVTDGAVAYGSLPVNTTSNTLELSDMQTASNTGSVAVDFNIKGQDSASWELADSNGADAYRHRFCNETVNNCVAGSFWAAMNETTYTTLATNTAASGAVTFQLEIQTPTSSGSSAQQSVDVTVQAVAT